MPKPPVVSDKTLLAVRTRYDSGLYLDAYAAGAALGPLDQWPGAEGLVLAGRLAWRLGANRLAARLHVRAYRLAPHDADVRYYWIMRRRERWGAWAAWRTRQRLGAPPPGDPPERFGDYHGQCAQLLAELGDVSAAEEQLGHARDAAPARAYWVVERVEVLQYADRHEEALAAAEAGWSAFPVFMPCALVLAGCLQTLDRHEDAVAVLREADARAQSGNVALLLTDILLRLRRLDEAAAAADRYDALTPLKERAELDALAARRGEIAVLRRDYRTAHACFESVPQPYYQSLAANLSTVLTSRQAAPRRVELAVPFVRQHHMTCAPATLTALARFWRRPAEHVAIAEEICYDGTPAHSERRWAENAGWVAREFRVDWPTAVALLDRGLPFTLTASGVTYGHLQAVIGYDEATRVLLARDPMTPDIVEINAAALLEFERASGPRGMTLVPSEQSALLGEVALPEAEWYDVAHAVDTALAGHDRTAAVAALEHLRAIAPSHRLTHAARRGLAAYDANPHESLAALDALLEQFPDEPGLQLARVTAAQQLAPRAERLAWLAAAACRRETVPQLQLEYVVELAEDGRRGTEALLRLGRILLQWRDGNAALFQLGVLFWRANRQAEATEVHRFVSCRAITREDYARTYFECCRLRRLPEVGLEFLRGRVARLGTRSCQPSLTLFEALEALGRTHEAFAALEEALALRPEDGELRLFAAGRCERYARAPEAARHRAAAQGRVRHTLWLAERAREFARGGDRAQALTLWREILETHPLDLDAHRAVSQLLTETEGRAAAQAHLQAASRRFPHHLALGQLRYEWSSGSSARDREAILRDIAASNPSDPWLLREFAINLHTQGRMAEALLYADSAVLLAPGEASSWAVRAWVRRSVGRRAEAADDCREALLRHADRADAIRALLDSCESAAEREAALAFVLDRVSGDSVSGEGVAAWYRAARGVLTPAEVLAALRQVHADREDLALAWSALIQHLLDIGLPEEALRHARQATARFPMLAGAWRDLGRVHAARHETDACVDALNRCLELDPANVDVVGQLVAVLERDQRIADAVALVEARLACAPVAAPLHAELARLLWVRGQPDDALTSIRKALDLDPDLAVAWDLLGAWAATMGHNAAILDAARTLADARPGEAAPWVRLGQLQLHAGQPADALRSGERAAAANAFYDDAWDLQAEALTVLRRFDEAEAACAPPVYEGRVPHSLLGRAAWVDARRGDRTAALARMRAVLTAYPDYVWGWRQLAEWAAEAEGISEALAAADQLTWLQPWSAEGHVLRGWMHARTGTPDQAAISYERAVRIDPSNGFAAFALFDLQLERRDFKSARRTLAIAGPYASPDALTSAEASLAAAEGDRDRSVALLRQLLAQDGAAAEAVWPAVESVAAAGWAEAAEPVLWQLLAGGACHPLTGAVWARLKHRRGQWVGAWGLRELANLGPPAMTAVYELLDAIGRDGGEAARRRSPAWRAAWELFWIRRRFRGSRFADDMYWGKVGYALLSRGRTAAAARWLADWRRRPNVQSWMLQNLIAAQLCDRQDAAALEALRYVGTVVVPREVTNPILRLWCASEAAVVGDLDRAERWLRLVPLDTVSADDRPLHDAVAAVVAALRTGPEAWTAASRAVMARARAGTAGDSASRRLVDLMALRGARHSGVPWRIASAWAAVHARPLTNVAVVAGLVALRVLLG